MTRRSLRIPSLIDRINAVLRDGYAVVERVEALLWPGEAKNPTRASRTRRRTYLQLVARPSAAPIRIRELKQAFDRAHRQGMRALQAGDGVSLSQAVEAERAVVAEQSDIINAHLARYIAASGRLLRRL